MTVGFTGTIKQHSFPAWGRFQEAWSHQPHAQDIQTAEYKPWFLPILRFSPIIWIWVLDLYIDTNNITRAPIHQRMQIQVLPLDAIREYSLGSAAILVWHSEQTQVHIPKQLIKPNANLMKFSASYTIESNKNVKPTGNF